jgi:hypothetical protein
MVRAVVIGVLALSIVSAFLFAMQERPLPVLLGFETEEDFLSRRLGWYHAAVDAINQDLPSDAVVLFLWEPRSYYCQAECLPDALLDRWLHATQYLYGPDAAADPGRVAAAVLAGKFDPITGDDVAALEALRHGELEEMQDFGGAYVLYRLRNP